MTMEPRTRRASRTELQEAAERVRVARTMCAAFPSAERQAELSAAIEAFKELRGAP